jgi:hypothetical protein
MTVKDAEVAEAQLSEGEKFIEEFLIDNFIRYESQKRIILSGDSKSFRVADFYLPKYGIYIEFFGKWNTSEDEKARYREKKSIYFKNAVPCIYLYPENLGIIEHVFHYRIRQTLRQHGMKRELRKYLLHDFNIQHSGLPIALAMITFISFVFIFKTIFQGPQTVADFLLSFWILSVIVLGGFYLAALFQFLRARKDR